MAPAATIRVSQPPSAIFRLLATTKVRSIAANTPTPTATSHRFTRQSPHATTPASKVVVTMVMDTAMP